MSGSRGVLYFAADVNESINHISSTVYRRSWHSPAFPYLSQSSPFPWQGPENNQSRRLQCRLHQESKTGQILTEIIKATREAEGRWRCPVRGCRLVNRECCCSSRPPFPLDLNHMCRVLDGEWAKWCYGLNQGCQTHPTPWARWGPQGSLQARSGCGGRGNSRVSGFSGPGLNTTVACLPPLTHVPNKAPYPGFQQEALPLLTPPLKPWLLWEPQRPNNTALWDTFGLHELHLEQNPWI